jgi:hypothetical protein
MFMTYVHIFTHADCNCSEFDKNLCFSRFRAPSACNVVSQGKQLSSQGRRNWRKAAIPLQGGKGIKSVKFIWLVSVIRCAELDFFTLQLCKNEDKVNVEYRYAAESAGFPKEVIESAREVKALLHRRNPSTPNHEVYDTSSTKVLEKRFIRRLLQRNNFLKYNQQMILGLGTSIKNLVHSTLDEAGMKAYIMNLKAKVLQSCQQ